MTQIQSNSWVKFFLLENKYTTWNGFEANCAISRFSFSGSTKFKKQVTIKENISGTGPEVQKVVYKYLNGLLILQQCRH